MRTFLVALALLLVGQNFAQTIWRGELFRKDGQTVPFNFDWRVEKGQPVWHVINATERLKVDSIRIVGDSIFVQMPFFESAFALKKVSADSVSGTWIKGSSAGTSYWPFSAKRNITRRFVVAQQPPLRNITGRYALDFAGERDSESKSIAILEQSNGGRLTGTVLTPTGDYRYLDGLVSADSIFLSTFDGSHAYTFKGKILGDGSMDGVFLSGVAGKRLWTARADQSVELDVHSVAVDILSNEPVNFRLPDVDSNLISVRDSHYKGKIVVIQLTGSWCPNCMDETKFLSEYYSSSRRPKDVEIIAVAYEYSTDFYRSKRSLLRFKTRFKVKYPMLISGVAVSDTLRTKKTFPQISNIKAFPTTLFLDGSGRVARVHAGFSGPATGAEYEKFKRQFFETIDSLRN